MLPDGYTWRPAGLADAEPISALVSAYNTAIIGFADYTLDDVRGDLLDPRLRLPSDTWLVHGSAPVGFAAVYCHGTGEHVVLEVVSAEPAVVDWLFSRALARADEYARAGGHQRVTADIGIYRDDKELRAAAAAFGFSQATTFHRMRVDHGPVAVEPVTPQGVTLRTGPGDEAFRRTGYALLAESFREHYGFVDPTFEQWHEIREAEPGFDWSMLTIAYLDGRPVGVLLTGDEFVEAENCGHVGDIGVLAEARGRGIAKFLLRTAFAADIRAGRVATNLTVDTNNVTPALRLYESVGMRPVLVIDMWKREWPAATPAS